MKRQIKAMLKACTFETTTDWNDDHRTIAISYLGSFMSLDPCGRYHHILSPNGITRKCERYWETLDKVAADLGGWIETGEGDPTDIFFCKEVTQ